MPKSNSNLEWFGADVLASRGDATTRAVLELPNKQIKVRTTSYRDDVLGELTARHKIARESVKFAPDLDRELWEQRERYAWHELQSYRFALAVDTEQSTEQRAHLRGKSLYHKGMAQEYADGIRRS